MVISMLDATALVIQEGFNTGNKEVISHIKKIEKWLLLPKRLICPNLERYMEAF